MNIKKISAQEYTEVLSKCENTTFAQLSKWGKLKETTNWTSQLLGFEENGELIGCVQVLFKKLSKTGYKVAYSAGGYALLNSDLETEVVSSLTKYLKSKRSFVFKIDPQLPYKVTKDFKQQGDTTAGDEYIKTFEKLGFNHLGFFNEFEGMQPRHTFRIDTTQEYSQAFKAMSKHAQRNIKTARKYKSLEVVEATLEDLPIFYDILTETALRDKFSIRNYQYFEDMMKLMPDEIRLTILRVDLNALKAEIEATNDKINKDIAKLLKKEKFSESQLQNLQTQLDSNTERLTEVSQIIATKGETYHLAGNLSICDGKNSWYLYGASSNDLRFLRSPYYLMDDAINYAITQNCDYYDMYGVSGIFEKDHPDYGLYTYKSGFGGDLVEFIGEFDKPLNKPLYFLFETLYPKLKKMRKKRARR